jgi:hypothetical protein
MNKRPLWLTIIIRLIEAIVLVAIITAIIFAIHQGAIGVIRRQIALPNCSATPLTQSPIQISDFSEIAPLGNVGVPDHTWPTDHMYLYYHSNITNSPLVAPGKIVVTNLEYSSETINGQLNHPGDYSITFTPCRGMSFYFAHIKSLEGILSDQTAGIMKSCDKHNPGAGIETLYCNKSVDITLKPGDLMGQIGVHGQAQAIDFGASKSGYIMPNTANRKLDGGNSVCPLDYFTKPVQTALYSKVNRTAQPLCGQINQDIVGTIQGNWSSQKDVNEAKNDWNSHLSIVHYSKNPAFGLIGIGGGPLGNPSGLGFVPKSNGLINREPSQTVVGNTYCYQSDRLANVPIMELPNPSRLLIKLISSTQMQVEIQPGTCDSALQFDHPVIYYR